MSESRIHRLKIFHFPRKRSVRVIWLCIELGIPFEVEVIDFSKEFRSSKEWRSLSPVGKIPLLQDGDLIIFESGAIMQHILSRYGNGRLEPKPGTDDHSKCLQWLWFGEATFARPLGEIYVHRREFSPPIEGVIKEMTQRVRDCCEALNEALQGKEYLMGEFSVADIMVGFTLCMTVGVVPFDDLANLTRYWKNVSAREAFASALSY